MSFCKLVTTTLLLSWACLCMPRAANALQSATPSASPKKTWVEIQHMSLKTRLDRMHDEADMLRARIAGEQKTLDTMGISPGAFDEVMKVLQLKRVNLMIELAGLEVRQKEATKLAASKPPKDDAKNKLVEVLERLASDAKANTDRVEKHLTTGSASQEKFLKAQRLQVEAELKLAELRAEMGSSAAEQPRLANQMLLEVSLAKAERKAELEMVNKLLDTYVNKARKVISSIDEKKGELDLVTQLLIKDVIELRNLDAKMQFESMVDEQKKLKN